MSKSSTLTAELKKAREAVADNQKAAKELRDACRTNRVELLRKRKARRPG